MIPSTTHWLALDLAGAITSWSIARMDVGKPCDIFDETIGQGQNHSEAMIPALIQLFEKSHLSMSAIQKLLVMDGPGSYTGLRIAYAAIKAFAMSKNLPVVAIKSHEAKALAYAESVLWELPYDHIYCVSNHSMNRYVSAHYRLRNNNQLQFVRENVVTGLNDFENADSALILTDDEDVSFMMPKEAGVEVKTFPLQANFLFKAFDKSTSKKEYTTLEEVIALSPTYYGESFKPIM